MVRLVLRVFLMGIGTIAVGFYSGREKNTAWAIGIYSQGVVGRQWMENNSSEETSEVRGDSG